MKAIATILILLCSLVSHAQKSKKPAKVVVANKATASKQNKQKTTPKGEKNITKQIVAKKKQEKTVINAIVNNKAKSNKNKVSKKEDKSASKNFAKQKLMPSKKNDKAIVSKKTNTTEKAIAKNKNQRKENDKKAIASNKKKFKEKLSLKEKIKKALPKLEIEHKEIVAVKESKFEMVYPTGFFESNIKQHFGKIDMGNGLMYPNESVSIITQLDKDVICNVDTAAVSDVATDDDGLYIVSLKHRDYTIVMANLTYADVAVGDTVVLGDIVGMVTKDDDYPNKGSYDLMLLKDKKILNPEKYLVRNLTPTPIVSDTTKAGVKR